MKEKSIDDNHYPLVTVGIPVYNVELYIQKSLLSILNQSYPNLEILIVDDHGTDNSIKIVDDLKNNKLKFFILFLLVFYKNIKNGIYCQDNNRFFRNVLL